MTHAAATGSEPTSLRPLPVWIAPEYDEDDDAADDDYDDDDEGIARPSAERWPSRAGFGSPEWWSGW